MNSLVLLGYTLLVFLIGMFAGIKFYLYMNEDYKEDD